MAPLQQPQFKLHRLLVPSLGIVGVTLLGVLVIFKYMEGVLIERSGERLAVTASQTADKLDRVFFERHGDVQMLARSFAAHRDIAYMTDYVSWMRYAYPVYRWIGVTDERGRIIAATDSTSIGREYARASWFVTAQQGLVIEDIKPRPELSGAPAVTFAAPLRDSDGTFHGIVVSFIGMPTIEDILGKEGPFRASPTDQPYEFIFIKQDGDVIMD